MVNVGLIGCGSIARKRHLSELSSNPNAKIVAVCDIVRERADEIAAEHGAKAYYDYKGVIGHSGIDAVLVLATNVLHSKMTVEALKAGKHVLCEKPMATSLGDAEAMIKAADETGRNLMIGHNQRLAPAHVKAKEILSSGRLGKVQTFRTTFGHQGCEGWAIDGRNTWFFEKRHVGLGTMADLGIHKADLLRWLLDETFCEAAAFTGTLEKRYAYGKDKGKPIDVEDNAVCLIRGKGGVMGTITASWSYKKEDNSTTLYCDDGVMTLFGPTGHDIAVMYADGSREFHDITGIQTNARQSDSGVSALFIKEIVSGVKPEIDGREGYEALKIVMACMESAEKGTVVRF